MIETERSVLRAWREEDVAPLLAICGDPVVMRHLGSVQDEAAVLAAMERQRASQARDGHCYWAAERKADGAMIGFCGLMVQAPTMPIAGQVDIGWRLARDAWGRGFAVEAARASLDWGWTNLDVPSVVAITVRANVRSWRLMERLGMTRCPDAAFDHPNLAHDDPLRPHIVYRINRPT